MVAGATTPVLAAATALTAQPFMTGMPVPAERAPAAAAWTTLAAGATWTSRAEATGAAPAQAG